MRLAFIGFLVLAACGGSGEQPGEGGPDGGGGQTGGADGGGGGGGSDTCGPANCDGCCDGDTCRAGDSDDECGAGGAACQACGRWGECSEAAICELAAGTRWNVVAESGTASPVNRGGTPWDDNGDLPDVFVHAYAFDAASGSYQSAQTGAQEDLTPTWNQTLFSDLQGSSLEGIQIELYDDDDNADDTFGGCIAAIRLEDAEAGALELTCPRGLGSDPTRAGWSLRLRLEPRSDGRPDAPALDRHAAAPRESEPGSCSITWDAMSTSRSVTIYDSWGRLIRQEWHKDSGEVSISQAFECSGADHCEEPGEYFSYRRLEPGPFGLRVRIAGFRVLLYDSLGRRVAEHSYSNVGSLFTRQLYLYTAKSRVTHYQSFDDDPYDADTQVAEFDEHGSPVLTVEGNVIREVEINGDGLPVHYEVVKSDVPETPVGSGWSYSYEGAGCAEALAHGETNGLVSR